MALETFSSEYFIPSLILYPYSNFYDISLKVEPKLMTSKIESEGSDLRKRIRASLVVLALAPYIDPLLSTIKMKKFVSFKDSGISNTYGFSSTTSYIV